MTEKLDNFGADVKPILTQPDDLNYQDSILTLQDSSLFGEKKREMRKNGVTCLHLASVSGKIDLVEYLIDVQNMDPKIRSTASES